MIKYTDPGTLTAGLSIDPDEVDRILAEGATLPAMFYTDPRIAQLEDELVFRRSWQFTCAELEVAKVGDYVATSIGVVPVVVIRAEGGLRAFVNVCRHRAHLVAVGQGNAETLRCTHDGWTYGVDGCLQSVSSSADGLRNLDGLGLYPIALDTWGGLVFVCVEPQEPLVDALGELPAICERVGYDFAFVSDNGLTFREATETSLAVNWKVFVENAVECYHCPTTHTHTFSDFYDVRASNYGHANYDRGIYHTARCRPEIAARWGPPEDAAPDFQFYYLWPNITFTGGGRSGRPIVFQVVPTSPGACSIVGRSYTRPDENDAHIAEFERMADQTLAEDYAVLERVQTGLESGVYQWGYTLPASEQNMRHFYALVWKALAPAFR